MHTFKLSAWLPVKNSTVFKTEQHRAKDHQLVISNFCKDAGEVIEKIDADISISSISQKEPSEKIRQYFSTKGNLIQINGLYDFIKIDAVILVKDNIQNISNEIFINQEAEIRIHFASTILVDAIEKLLILTELSSPGNFETFHGVVSYQDDQYLSIKEKKSFPYLIYPYDETWPALQKLNIMDVYQWSISMGFIEKGLAVTRIERAFASYTHAIGLSWSNEGEVLFRCLQGLESFYCDGIGELRKQLSEKSQLFLGEWPDSKNIVGHLYDLRSKFIHGSCSIEFWNTTSDVYSENEKLMIQLNHGVSFSVRLLIGTLQKCIKEDLTDISWSYKMIKYR